MENLTLGSFVNLEDFQLKTNMALFSCVIVLICKQICQQDASRQELILFLFWYTYLQAGDRKPAY